MEYGRCRKSFYLKLQLMSTVVHHGGARNRNLDRLNDFVGAEVAERDVAGGVDQTRAVERCHDDVSILCRNNIEKYLIL